MARADWSLGVEGEVGCHYAQRLDAHWNSLPTRRKLHILAYLAWRLVRSVRDALTEALRTAPAGLAFMATQTRAYLAACIAEFRWLLRPEGRREACALLRSIPTFNVLAAAAALVVWASVLGALGGLQAPQPGSSVVELARRAQSMRPAPCYLTSDGEIWIDADDGLWRPGRRDYRARRQQICGF